MFVPVGDVARLETQPARLELSWSDAATLRSGPVTGRVTALPVLPALFDMGATVIEVDGIARPVVTGPRPLWRPLADGVAGPDVDQVHSLLVELGYASGDPPDSVDATFMDAVGAFEAAVGWPRTGEFEPQYAVWLPVAPFEIDGYDVAVGELLPAESPLTSSNAQVVSAKVVGLDPTTPVTVPNPYEFEVLSGPTLRVDSGMIDGSDFGIVTDAAYDLAPDTGRPELLDGIARATEETRAQTVPADAIIIGTDGSQCVKLADNAVVAVTVIGGSSGISELEPTLPAEAMVLANPADADTSRCVSS